MDTPDNTTPLSSKQCFRCKIIKPVENFGVDRSRPDGHASSCKECSKQRSRITPQDGYKYCPNCKQEKIATQEFWGYRSRSKDGLSNQCSDCLAIKRRIYYVDHQDHACEYSRQYAKDNPEKVNKTSREWGKRNPDKKKKYNNSWKKANRQKHLDGRRRRYQLHKEQRRAEAKEWRKKNPDLTRFHWKVRQARIRTNGGNHTMHDIKRIFDEQEERCAYCGITLFWYLKGDIHVDHFHPVVRGGSNNPDNIRCACQDCNLSKKDKTYDEWVAWRGW